MDTKKNLGIPAAIIVAGLLIAAAVYYGPSANRPEIDGEAESKTLTTKDIPAVTSADHVRIVPGAKVTIIEYSDLECPFCKDFHESLNTLSVTPDLPKFNWVYRHFPLAELHSQATKEAEATECAAELGGNDAFWAYLDEVFAVTPSNDGLDPAELPKIAVRIGLDEKKFTSCLASGKHAARVAKNVSEAEKLGATGTPFPVIITENGQVITLPGALPLPQLKELLRSL